LKNDLVSIITPSYNTAGYIAETINSVLNQTYTNWELIIIDDCSSDNTTEVVNTFNDKRIVYLQNDTNSGAAISRNRAIKAAKGRWIAFLDSDDVWEPKKLEKQIAFMEENGYSFSYTGYCEIDEQSNPNGKVILGPKRITKKKMYDFCWPGCLTVMYDAEKVGKIQIEALPKNNDYAMWLKIVKYADCYLLDEVLAKYRKRSGSISNHSYVKLIKHHYLLYKVGEKRSSLISLVLTVRNLFWGFYKKKRYVKYS